jgi:hypothetical protein
LCQICDKILRAPANIAKVKAAVKGGASFAPAAGAVPNRTPEDRMPFGLLFFWCVLMPITADWSGGFPLPGGNHRAERRKGPKTCE